MATEIKPVHNPSMRSRFEYGFAVIVLIIAAVLLSLGVYNFVQAQQRKATDQQQIEQVKQLTKQVKDLSQQNKQLNQTANNYAYCNAQILAKYTQTQQPITISDLNACVLSSFPSGSTAPNSGQSPIQNNQTQRSSSPSSVQSSPSSSSALQPAASTPSQPSQPSNPQPTTPPSILTTPLLPCVDLLGIAKTC